MKRLGILLASLAVLSGVLFSVVRGPAPVQWVYAVTWATPPTAAVTPTPTSPGSFEGPASCHADVPPVASAWAPYREKAQAVAARYHLEPLVFLYQIHQESGFNPNAVSAAGAIGIAQFLPATAAGMQPPVNPWDVDSALDGAARLDLSQLRAYWGRSLTIATRFGGNRNAYVWGLALAAYNAGGRAVNA